MMRWHPGYAGGRKSVSKRGGTPRWRSLTREDAYKWGELAASIPEAYSSPGNRHVVYLGGRFVVELEFEVTV